jgi:uncharacterized protein (TIGR03437 family)
MLTAAVSPALATGKVTFTEGSVTLGVSALSRGLADLPLSTLPAGSHSLMAAYAGDKNDLPTTSSILNLTINPGVPATVTVTSSANPVTFGQPVTVTATASLDVSGTVTFYDGTAVLGSRMLTGGKASWTTNLLSAGKHSLRAYYSGDGTYNFSQSPALLQTVTTRPANGFQAGMSRAISGSADSTIVADINGDGKADIVLQEHNGGVYVLLGNGDGTFQQPLTVTSYGYGVAVGDFDGDGRPDLAMAAGEYVILVFLGNGDGTFQPPATYFGGFRPDYLAVADFNGDGRADIVAGDIQDTTVGVLLGNGDGTFQPITYSPANPVVFGLVVGDFNGDGKADVAFGAYENAKGSIGILLGNGDGSFQNAVYYDIGDRARSISTGDFNGDGKTDLAAALETGAVAVLLGNGDGTFHRASNYGVGPPAYIPSFNQSNLTPGIAVGDVNGDNNADIVVGGAFGASVLLGNGDGTFQEPAYYGTGSNTVAVADFNGDGRSDLVIGNLTTYNLSVLLGAATSAPSISSTGVVNAASQDITSPLAPGSVATAYGSFLANSPSTASVLPLSDNLAGLSLHFDNGLKAPLLSASSGKVTFQVPWELTGQSQSNLSVTSNGQTSAAQIVNLAPFAPSIFATNGRGFGQAAVYDSSNRLVDASNPTTAGKTIVIYCTGLGPVAPDQPASGFPAPGNPLLHTTTPISVAIGNMDAPVLFSGLVPGLVGVYQVNAVVPPGIDRSYPPGVTITVKGGVAVNFAAPTIVVK